MNDDVERDDDVRGWLSSVEPPEMGLNVAGAIKAGQARVRRRRLAVTGAAAVAALAVAAVPAVAANLPRPGGGAPAPGAQSSAAASANPVSCTATPLAIPDGLKSKGARDGLVTVAAVDPSGRYVVAETHGSVNNSPAVVLWTDGEPVILPTEGESVTPVAVNAHGVVVGTGWLKAAPPMSGEFAWIYSGGKASRLTMPVGYTQDISINAVSEAGAVLGTVYTSGRSHQTVVLWPAGTPDQPQILSALSDKSIQGVWFGSDGEPVAWSRSSSNAVLWSADGKRRTLKVPAGASAWSLEAVRGSWAVGWAEIDKKSKTRGRPLTPLRWDLRTGALTTLPAGERKKAVDVDPAGDVLLWTSIVRADGREVELAAPDGRSPFAVGFTDSGTTVVGRTVVDEAVDIAQVGAVPEVETIWYC